MMRSFLAGLLILGLSATGAFGQVTGFVEGIGYGNAFRPDCWTPALINLTSQISEPMNYQLQVWQEDLDRDRVVFTKDITLSPKTQDKFQLYFMPRPTDNGLPPNPAELQRALQVRVCLPPKEGQRPEDARVVIERLPVQFPATNEELVGINSGGSNKGRKLILWVSDGSSKPAIDAFSSVVGNAENVDFVRVPVSELGENVLYYAAADAVLWLSGNADELDRGGAKRLEALEEYVREGGNLVVCQPVERGKIAAFARLLPIELKDAADNWLVEIRERATFDKDLDALPQLTKPPRDSRAPADAWELVKGPIQLGIAKTLKPDAIVDEPLEYWDAAKTSSSPFIVRHSFGLGAVSWVAQDLGSSKLAAASGRWAYIWDRVFGWTTDTHTPLDAPKPVITGGGFGNFPGQGQVDSVNGTVSVYSKYQTNDNPVDLGESLLRGMDFDKKGSAYVFLAVLFFIAYWIIAGPGTYLFLSSKKKREMNWFMFGFWAFAATALTLVVVKLLLRGSPEIRHQTVVRFVAGQPALVHSRIGLYIPRDGYQTIELKDADKESTSYITPYNIPLIYQKDTDYPSSQDYAIPVHDDPQPVRVQVPFRSTLKKLTAQWVGDLQTGVSGSPKLVPAPQYIAGKVTNQTGTDLRNVHFVFHHVLGGPLDSDWVLYLPQWKKDETLDLAVQYGLAKYINPSSTNNAVRPGQNVNIKGWINTPTKIDWASYWHEFGSLSIGSDHRGDDFESDSRRSLVIMSLIDRIRPDQRNGTDHTNSIEFLRRGGRDLNMSQLVGAGQLVILAEARDRDRPLPFPLLVEGDKVAGEGVVLYQFALPLDRTEMLKDLADAEKKDEKPKP